MEGENGDGSTHYPSSKVPNELKTTRTKEKYAADRHVCRESPAESSFFKDGWRQAAGKGKEALTCLMKSWANLSCSWMHFSSSARKKLKARRGQEKEVLLFFWPRLLL